MVLALFAIKIKVGEHIRYIRICGWRRRDSYDNFKLFIQRDKSKPEEKVAFHFISKFIFLIFSWFVDEEGCRGRTGAHFWPSVISCGMGCNGITA